MKRFILGDIHGGYKSLMQCFERSKFDYQNDKLIVLGDVCDGWSETKECIDELLKIKHRICLIGNHDYWTLDYFKNSNTPDIWISQGGYNTVQSYKNGIPKSHVAFLKNAKLWHIEDNILFVHGGIKANTLVEENNADLIMWDRELIKNARMKGHNRPNKKMQSIYDEIFIGHTTTLYFKTDKPVKFCEINDIDTGGGWSGKLTIMDLDTREYWQSDFVRDLYPNSEGRNDYIAPSNSLFHGHP
jgi:serine/threonine protein phosphatase 1